MSGANIVDAKIMTMANGMALDTFWVQDRDGGPIEAPDKLTRGSRSRSRTMLTGGT